ncbi:MAG: phosphatidate cytidylyltransferase [Candidatus Limnocylindrales bacterium]
MLRQRVVSAAAFAPIVVLAVVAGPPWITLFVALLAYLAAREVFTLLRLAGYANLPLLGSTIAVAGVAVAFLMPDDADKAATVLAAAIVLAAVGGLARSDPREGFQVWMATVFGGLYAGLLAFVVRIADAPAALPAGAPLASLGAGRAWLIVLIVGVWTYDSGAYLAGRRFGRRRLMAHVSPSKTWEGLLGGLVACTAISALTLQLAGQAPLGALVLGPLIAAAAQVGDLIESMLKRAGGALDSGLLIPGHGGVLDRVDSFLLAAPATFFYLLAVTPR